MKVTSQTCSPTCSTPTFWPANTTLRLTLCRCRHPHAQRLMGALLVVALDEGIEARLLLEHIRLRRAGGLPLQGEVHALVPAVLLRLARLDPLDQNAEPQPPHGELTQPVESMPGRKGHPVVGPHGAREPE